MQSRSNLVGNLGRFLVRWTSEPIRLALQTLLWRQEDKQRFAHTFRYVNALTTQWPISLGVDGDVFKISDSEGMLYVARKERLQLYRHGIATRFQRLEDEYLLRNVSFQPGDVVVDVGANIGEVSMLLARRHGCRIISVEPEEKEFKCLQRNLAGLDAVCLNVPLWCSETDLKFYTKNESGDSSLFEVHGYSSVRTVRTATLKSMLDAHAPGRVRLLKLEAEGAEPEILAGAGDWLDRIDYVAADVGPERGMSQESTAAPVIRHMLNAGFDLEKMSGPRMVCLFRNRQMWPGI